jgi:hypothetical protein
MHMNSKDDALRAFAEHNGYIIVENTTSGEKISLRHRDGTDIEFDDGYERPCPWRISRELFDEFLREGWIKEGDPLEPDQRLYELTRKGFERANPHRIYQVGDAPAWTSDPTEADRSPFEE